MKINLLKVFFISILLSQISCIAMEYRSNTTVAEENKEILPNIIEFDFDFSLLNNLKDQCPFANCHRIYSSNSTNKKLREHIRDAHILIKFVYQCPHQECGVIRKRAADLITHHNSHQQQETCNNTCEDRFALHKKALRKLHRCFFDAKLSSEQRNEKILILFPQTLLFKKVQKPLLPENNNVGQHINFKEEEILASIRVKRTAEQENTLSEQNQKKQKSSLSEADNDCIIS